jgi:hypothetical protein
MYFVMEILPPVNWISAASHAERTLLNTNRDGHEHEGGHRILQRFAPDLASRATHRLPDI